MTSRTFTIQYLFPQSTYPELQDRSKGWNNYRGMVFIMIMMIMMMIMMMMIMMVVMMMMMMMMIMVVMRR